MMLTFPWMPSSFVGCANIATLAHRDAVRRGHPLHQTGLISLNGEPAAETEPNRLHSALGLRWRRIPPRAVSADERGRSLRSPASGRVFLNRRRVGQDRLHDAP